MTSKRLYLYMYVLALNMAGLLSFLEAGTPSLGGQDSTVAASQTERESGFDRFARVLGHPQMFSEELNEENLKKDLQIIATLDEPEHKIILYSVLHRFYLKTKDPRNVEEVLEQELKSMEVSLKKELFDEQVRNFVAAEGRQPNEEQSTRLNLLANHRYHGFMAMAPYEKSTRLEEIEEIYRKKDGGDELKHSRMVFFEWAREKMLEELQEYHLYAHKKPRTGWAKYRGVALTIILAAAAVTGGYFAWKGWGGDKESLFPKESTVSGLKDIAVGRLKIYFEKEDRIKLYTPILKKEGKYGIPWNDIYVELRKIYLEEFKTMENNEQAVSSPSASPSDPRVAQRELVRKFRANKLMNIVNSDSNRSEVIRRAISDLFGEEIAKKCFPEYYKGLLK